MTKEPRLDQEAIAVLIHAAERRHGITLCMEDYLFIQEAIKGFAEKAIDKFVAGAVEHKSDDSGDSFVRSVDHQQESEKEIFDLWFYNQGQKCKQQLRSNSVEKRS